MGDIMEESGRNWEEEEAKETMVMMSNKNK